MSTAERYTGNAYKEANPDWHVADSPWKAAQVLAVLGESPASVCEVGCGAGEILKQIHDARPSIRRLVGYEIASDAMAMTRSRETARLTFEMTDAAQSPEHFDVMLIMDVIEHVPDPIGFLEGIRHKSDRTLLHVPLDLSVQSVVRANKLLSLRADVGHIHYFTLETALATVEDAGYSVAGYTLTRSFDLPQGSALAQLARVPRRLLPPKWVVRLLGGYSVLIDACNGAESASR